MSAQLDDNTLEAARAAVDRMMESTGIEWPGCYGGSVASRIDGLTDEVKALQEAVTAQRDELAALHANPAR